MELRDVVATVGALVCGYLAAVVGITLLPAAIGVAVAALVTIGVRLLIGTRSYALLTGVLFFTVVSAAMLAQGEGAPMSPSYAWLLAYLAVIGLVLNEALVRMSDVAQSGGVERTDRHRLWGIPTAAFGVALVTLRETGIDGIERWIVGGTVAIAAVFQAIAAVLGVSVLADMLFSLSVFGILALFPVASPVRFTDSRRSVSLIDVVASTMVGMVRSIQDGSVGTDVAAAGVAASGASGSTGSASGGSSVKQNTVQESAAERTTTDDPASESVAEAGSEAAADAGVKSSTGDRSGNTTTAGSDSNREAAETDHAQTSAAASGSASDGTGDATAEYGRSGSSGDSTDEASSAPGTASPSNQSIVDDSTCRNCGATGDNVGARSIVDYPNAPETVALCEDCDAARRSGNGERTTDPAGVDWGRVLDCADHSCHVCAGDSADLQPFPIVPLDEHGHRHEFNVVPLCSTCHGAAAGD